MGEREEKEEEREQKHKPMSRPHTTCTNLNIYPHILSFFLSLSLSLSLTHTFSLYEFVIDLQRQEKHSIYTANYARNTITHMHICSFNNEKSKYAESFVCIATKEREEENIMSSSSIVIN